MRTAILAAVLALGVSSPAYALTHFLTKQWFDRGSTFCRYDNGTVLNVGAGLCPLSIEG